MKKRVISAILCGMMAASLLGTVAFADETKTFTVGFDAEYPPYGYMGDDGEYTGFDLELAQAVCDLEGWELVKTPTTGSPRIWSWIPVPLIASGTVSR